VRTQPLPASLVAAIAQLHAAMAKVANGDISAIKALYSHSDDATSFYGWGGYEKGWDAVSKR
jgi:predicted RNA polymerase sigma factor